MATVDEEIDMYMEALKTGGLYGAAEKMYDLMKEDNYPDMSDRKKVLFIKEQLTCIYIADCHRKEGAHG